MAVKVVLIIVIVLKVVIRVMWVFLFCGKWIIELVMNI